MVPPKNHENSILMSVRIELIQKFCEVWYLTGNSKLIFFYIAQLCMLASLVLHSISHVCLILDLTSQMSKKIYKTPLEKILQSP